MTNNIGSNGANTVSGLTLGATKDGIAGDAWTLTPDALMTYCSVRLRGLDREIYTRVNGEQADQKTTSLVGDLLSKIAAQSTGIPGDEAHSDAFNALHLQFQDAIKALSGAHPELANKLKEAMKIFEVGNDTCLSETEMTGLKTAVTNVSGAMSESREIAMMEVQSLVSQRQTAVQACTNIMQTVNETLKSITGNYRS